MAPNSQQTELEKAFTAAQKIDETADKKPSRKADGSKTSKKWLICLIIGIGLLLGGVAMFLVPIVVPKEALPDLNFPTIPSKVADEKIYSNLTGLAVASEAEKTAPAYCVQTPNGTDGARPQAGLNQAGVIFEAIAEAGITRFAAIYQNPTSAVIGPIRSLRIYYLQWDTPFDCTIVHAGGAADALAAVARGGYKDLSENYTYMYRGSYGVRRWNNLFTTSTLLGQFSTDRGYSTSNITGLTRMTPEQSLIARVNETVAEKLVITEAVTENTAKLVPKVANIAVNFGGWATFNVRYTYDATTNTYLRSYETGAAHEVYECPEGNLGEVNPEDKCTLKQMAPAVVAVMIVQEKRAAYDGYHEDITTLGSGEAYVFQNGIAIHGKWVKDSVEEQIKFYDDTDTEIALAPGQTFIEAVPTYGGVEY